MCLGDLQGRWVLHSNILVATCILWFATVLASPYCLPPYFVLFFGLSFRPNFWLSDRWWAQRRSVSKSDWSELESRFLPVCNTGEGSEPLWGSSLSGRWAAATGLPRLLCRWSETVLRTVLAIGKGPRREQPLSPDWNSLFTGQIWRLKGKKKKIRDEEVRWEITLE